MLKALRSLSVEIYTIPEFSFLRAIPESLERLSLGETQSKSLSLESLSRFTMLRQLHLAGHQTHLDAISHLRRLEGLRLTRMSSPKLEFLSSLPRLWSLELRLGGSKDVSAIAEAKGLKHLRLTWIRGLADVAFIARMRSLRYLGLDKLRQVQSLPEFLGLTELKVLWLENLKGLISISSIAGAPALEWISFVSANNFQPADFEAVLRMPSLKGIHVGFGNFAKNEELAEMARSRGAKTLVGIPEDLYA
jgi:hypothetical protein